MSAHRIYADFNGLVAGPRNADRTAVVLDTFGSLRDLANAGVVLVEGLPLIAVDWSDDEEDLEGHGTAQFDACRQWWVVEFDAQGVRYVPAGDRTTPSAFRCVQCRASLDITAPSFRASATCPHCGTRLTRPLDPPREPIEPNSLPVNVARSLQHWRRTGAP